MRRPQRFFQHKTKPGDRRTSHSPHWWRWPWACSELDRHVGTGACPSGGDARSSHQQEASHTYSFLPPSLSFLKQLRFQCEKGASLLISPLLLLSSSHSGRKETRIPLLLPPRICTEGDGTAQLLTELAPATLLALGQHSGSIRGQLPPGIQRTPGSRGRSCLPSSSTSGHFFF